MTDRLSRRHAKQVPHPDGFCQATIDEFEAYLNASGYAASTVEQYVGLTKRFYAWLRHPKNRLHVVSVEAVSAFISRCKAQSCLRHVHHLQSSLGHLIKMLRDQGKLVQNAPPPTVIDIAIQQFTSHLRDTCGFAEATCRRHSYYIRRFLEYKFGNGRLHLKRICRDDLMNFVGGYAKQSMPGAAQAVAAALRQYLRLLQQQGVCNEVLVASVPTTPRWKLATLPRTMTEDQLRKLLSSFDRSTDMGRRDHVMVLLMATLGLRACEVALLQLDDVNWRDSTLRIVVPKTRRTNILPLPNAAGKAIADYLRHGRPSITVRHLFVRHTAPRDIPLSSGAIRAAAIRGYHRCGFDPRWKGTHILRHTVATQLHQRGGTLKDVADLLGHRSIETSAIYAKVNLPALAAVAMPWPEVTK